MIDLLVVPLKVMLSQNFKLLTLSTQGTACLSLTLVLFLPMRQKQIKSYFKKVLSLPDESAVLQQFSAQVQWNVFTIYHTYKYIHLSENCKSITFKDVLR